LFGEQRSDRAFLIGVVYSVEAHGNDAFLGIGLTMFGAAGPGVTRYNAFALTLNGGWFGR
jgi:hypothetical protein